MSKSKKYYWRVKVKSTNGTGPWSNTWNFVTTLTIPGIPQLVSATPYQTGYVALKWKQVKDADQYLIQISYGQSFSSIFKSISTSETADTISWFTEGQKYYWRVQAKNIAGSGSWSDISNFTLIAAPTNLVLQKNAPNEITLTWKDNSAIEDGYVIER